VTANFDLRYSSSAEIAAAVAELLKDTPGANIPSRRTILRWLVKEGFKNVKITFKPGLNKAQKMRRLEFTIEYRDWTIEDWKKVV